MIFVVCGGSNFPSQNIDIEIFTQPLILEISLEYSKIYLIAKENEICFVFSNCLTG